MADNGVSPASVLQALHRLTVTMSGTANLSRLAKLAATNARQLLGADDVVLYLWDPDAQLLRLAYGENSGHGLMQTMTEHEGAIGQAFTSGEPTVITDYQHWDRALPEIVRRGVQRMLAVPLKIDSHTVGVLAVRFCGPHGCDPAQVQALQLLAAPVAAARELTQQRPSNHETAGLTAREREVLARVGQGETNRQIAVALGLSPGTVKKHVEHILRKLGAADRTQAAVRAAQLGLVTPPARAGRPRFSR